MRKHSMPEMKEGGVNVTPLIDIVMCLIVFFMLVAKIGVDTGSDKTITIPSSIWGTNIKDMGNCLNLNVRQGPATSEGNPEPLVTALIKGKITELHVYGNRDSLTEALKYFRNGNAAANIPPNPNFQVIIRGDGDMAFEYLEPVLTCCAQAQVKNVNFVTKEVQHEVQ